MFVSEIFKEMEHEHSHNHSVALENVNTAFITGIVFNFLFVVIEAVTGLVIHSLSLLSDAGHNLADVGALALSLFAFRLLKIKPTEHFTYGYRKTSVLAALFNAVILLVSIGAIVFEAVHRLFHPEPLQGFTIAIIAAIGIVINFVTAILFLKHKEKDLNIKSAYLHLMSDAAVSIALVIGGIIIHYTGLYWVDSVLSIVIAVVIFLSTWSLLKSSFRLSMDAVPEHIDITDVKAAALRVNGVKDLHHVHIWALSTTENALTAHMVVSREASASQEQEIKHNLKHVLFHKNIHHITLETERENEPCESDGDV